MFRRRKPQLSPPLPPVFSDILQDLETFEIEKNIEEIRQFEPSSDSPASNTSNSSSSFSDQANSSASNIYKKDLENWWKAFETFTSDIHIYIKYVEI